MAHRLVAIGARVTLVDSLVPAYGGNIFNIHGLEDMVSVNIADVAVFAQGSPCDFDGGAIRRVFEQKEITIGVDLGVGAEAARAWGTAIGCFAPAGR